MAERDGFTLVEAAVAIAVVSILAGMMAPMAVKLIEQRRTAATRKALRQAFEAMFGRRDRRIANMQADFGFRPENGHYRDLRFLVAKARPWNSVPDFGDHGQQFHWGYNGPYWLGETQGGVPVDAWGNPIELVCERGRVQVRSHGRTRAPGDDLVYPPEPVPLDSFRARVLVTITPSRPDQRGRVQLVYGGNDWNLLSMDGPKQITGEAGQSLVFSAPAGGMQVECLPFNQDESKVSTRESKRGAGDNKSHGAEGAPSFRPVVIPMDLLPGETREVRVNL